MTRHTFFCIDGHTCGNPVRVVTGGSIPVLEGATMFERRQHFLSQHDWIRTGLMFEPRGHDMMSGSILYPPTRDDCDVGIFFIETSGCLPMCGHGTIGTVTIALENGLIQPKVPGLVRLDTPAGVVEARYAENGPFIDSVRITTCRPSSTRGLRGRGREPRLGSASTSPMAAISTPSSSRKPLYSDLADVNPSDIQRWSPSCAPAFNARYEIAHPEIRRSTGSRTCCGPASRRRRAAPPQRRVLRRQGDRPLALRHRHLGPHGASRRERRSRRGRRGRRRVDPPLDLHRPHRRANEGRQPRGHHPLDRGLGPRHRPQHHHDRRPRPVRARLSGGGQSAREPPVIRGP